MEFIRKPLWALFVLLALGCQQTQTMEESDSYLQIPIEMQVSTIKDMFFMEKTDKTNFRDIGINLSIVCKYWSDIIKVDAKKWVCEYFNIDEKDKDIFWRVFKGKLIYKPDPNSDNGRVDLFISALPNPLEGAFDLSRCGNAGRDLSINMGYRKEVKLGNDGKVEIWFAPRFVIETEIDTTATHLKAIFPSQWPGDTPIGILWTWIDWSLASYDFLTTENMDNLSKINLLENWERAVSLSFEVLGGDELMMERTAGLGMDFKVHL